MKLLQVVAVIVLLVGLGHAMADSSDRAKREHGRHRAQAKNHRDHRAGAHRHDRTRPATKHAPSSRSGHRSKRSHRPTATHSHRPTRTFLVTRIVDGDTLELGNGETVRLVGIDTPEIGQCGYQAASDRLAALVLGRRVRLTISAEDRDRYGRLLRYVDVGRTDAGLTLVRQGFAVARYDSRDGYGFHPRQPRYTRADRGSRPRGCARPASQPVPLVGGNGACAPGYDPCVPAFPPDVDCADVHGPVLVTGPDPHGLDGDGDGVACE